MNIKNSLIRFIGFLFKGNRRKEDRFKSFIHNIGSQTSETPSHDLFNCKETLKNSRFKVETLHFDNSFYGTEYSLNLFCGHDKPIPACIEHGLFFGSYVSEREYIHSGFSSLLTFSEIRKQHIREKTKIPVIPLGPYIAYAPLLLSKKELNEKKASFGKTLLVFPSHSTAYSNAAFDYKALINEILLVKKQHGFKTIIVNLFWKDWESGLEKPFSENGFLISTCGYQRDPFFLSRLKSLILLADVTMSNSVGTNLGYCVFLGKPHYVFCQNVIQSAAQNETGEFEKAFVETRNQEKKEVEDAFRSYSERISISQKNICSRYWGFSNVLSKNQLLSLFTFLDVVDKKSHKRERHFQYFYRSELEKAPIDIKNVLEESIK